MILLCDLDGTLLSNSMENFQPAYLNALGKHLSSRLPPERMVRELLHGTKKMLESNDPMITLEEAFDAHFYPQLGVEKQTVIDLILDFYTNVFPSLGSLTRQIPEAIEFIHSQISSGNRVVIATNPLFPRIATFNRLVWAGLPVDQEKFELVTTYEFMHFAKPRVEYYAEMLAYLGYPDEPVIMFGNDFEEDILAARQLNIPAFWLTTSEPINGNLMGYPHAGTYMQLSDFMKVETGKPYLYSEISLTAFAAIMKATSAALNTYTRYACGKNSDEETFTLENLISTRYINEYASISELLAIVPFSILQDKLIRNTGNHATDQLKEFVHNRLLWLSVLQQIDIQSLDPKSSILLSSFKDECIASDRKLMLHLAKQNKEWPRFVNPQH